LKKDRKTKEREKERKKEKNKYLLERNEILFLCLGSNPCAKF
jgi:hypothetical protein